MRNSPKHLKAGRRSGRGIVVAAFVTSVLALTGTGVYAALNATATGTSAVTSGSLLLTLTADGPSAGLPETIAAMAPGDVYNVYVNLNNTGTLASAAGMTLGASASPSNALTDGSIAGEGLSVTVTQCGVAWSGGSCSGSTTTILAATPLSTFTTAQSLSNVPALAASTGALAHLQFSLTLAGAETSTNGVLPSPSVQGLSTTITWTFTEQQRAGSTTNA